jgi:hypothetical protein
VKEKGLLLFLLNSLGVFSRLDRVHLQAWSQKQGLSVARKCLGGPSVLNTPYGRLLDC